MSELDPGKVEITQGEDKSFLLELLEQKVENGPFKPFVLDAAPTTVEVRMDGTTVIQRFQLGAQVTVEDAPNGVLRVTLAEVDTDLLKVLDDEGQDIEVKVVQDIPSAGTTKYFNFKAVAFVSAQRFPEP